MYDIDGPDARADPAVRARWLPDRRALALGRRGRADARALPRVLRARVGDRSRARRGQLHARRHAPRPHAPAVQRVEGRPLARAHHARRAQRALRRQARRRAGHAAPAGQHDLEAAVGQGAARPPGRGLRAVPRAAEHDDVLDGARRDGGRHGHDLLRARLARLGPRCRPATRSTRPTTGSAGCTRCARPTSRPRWCRSRCRRAARRSITASASTARRPTSGPMPTGARSSATWSRRRRPGTRRSATRSTRATCGPDVLEMDEVYFPIMWREDGHRTPFIESHFSAAA